MGKPRITKQVAALEQEVAVILERLTAAHGQIVDLQTQISTDRGSHKRQIENLEQRLRSESSRAATAMKVAEEAVGAASGMSRVVSRISTDCEERLRRANA